MRNRNHQLPKGSDCKPGGFGRCPGCATKSFQATPIQTHQTKTEQLITHKHNKNKTTGQIDRLTFSILSSPSRGDVNSAIGARQERSVHHLGDPHGHCAVEVNACAVGKSISSTLAPRPTPKAVACKCVVLFLSDVSSFGSPVFSVGK